MSKLYFYNEDDETCTGLNDIKDMIAEENLEERVVFEARKMTGEGVFWCGKYDFAGVSGESDCGKQCEGYKPMNGKNGRCTHSGYCYEPSKDVLIKA